MKEYYQLKGEDLVGESKVPLVIAKTNENKFQTLAQEMVDTIEANNAKDEPPVIICSV
ncbi:hypothetical protein ACTGZQ_00350 [Streptococcus suis]